MVQSANGRLVDCGLLALNPHDYYLWRALEVTVYVNILHCKKWKTMSTMQW